MRNKYVFTAVLLGVLTLISVAVCVTKQIPEKNAQSIQVVTSFYPIYIAVINVTDGIEGVEVQCLSQPAGGCVHDHQLTTEDMRLLEQADLLVVNGAGMEGYLQSVIEHYPQLITADSSAGIALLASEEEEEHAHVEEESVVYNAHIWMDMEKYCIQIENIGNALAKADPVHEKQYQTNVRVYTDKVKGLLAQSRECTSAAVRAVSTHEAFSYFSRNFPCDIVKTINLDENTSLNPQELGEIVTAVKEQKIPYVFTEEIYGGAISRILDKETDCKTLELDPLVGGKLDKDAYLDGMSGNIKILKEAGGQ